MTAQWDELPDQVIDVFERGGVSIDGPSGQQLLDELAGHGYQLVPASVVPRSAVLASASDLLIAAGVATPLTDSGGEFGPNALKRKAAEIQHLRRFAAAALGIDLDEADALADRDPS